MIWYCIQFLCILFIVIENMKANQSKPSYTKIANKIFTNHVNTEGDHPNDTKPLRNLNANYLNRKVHTQSNGDQTKPYPKKYILKKHSKNVYKAERFTYNKQCGLSNKCNKEITRTSYNQFQPLGSMNNNKKLHRYRRKQEDNSMFQCQENMSTNKWSLFQNSGIQKKLKEDKEHKREEWLSNQNNPHSLLAKKIKEDIIDKQHNKRIKQAKVKHEQEDYRELLKNKKNLKISDFNIIKLIGAGTFGKVYNATYQKTGIKVAIKKVHNDTNYKNREIELMRIVNNPFVIRQLADFITIEPSQSQTSDQYKEYYHFVMPTYSFNLYEHLQNVRSKGSLHAIQIKIILYQLFRGLLYLHSRDICHRDLKPQNILINQNNNMVICDLGSAKILTKGENNVAYICSRCYRAPQLIFGYTSYSFSIDIWSAGCIILEILNGHPLFIGKDSLQHLVEIMKVMGTPSKQQISQMNPEYNIKNFEVPKIPKKHWNQIFPRIQQNLVSLLNCIMVYNPSKRLNAGEILSHPYFNELREQSVFRGISKITDTTNFFIFDHYEIKYTKGIDKLIPKWYKNV